MDDSTGAEDEMVDLVSDFWGKGEEVGVLLVPFCAVERSVLRCLDG